MRKLGRVPVQHKAGSALQDCVASTELPARARMSARFQESLQHFIKNLAGVPARNLNPILHLARLHPEKVAGKVNKVIHLLTGEIVMT